MREKTADRVWMNSAPVTVLSHARYTTRPCASSANWVANSGGARMATWSINPAVTACASTQSINAPINQSMHTHA